jgi:hypothetical protein
MLTLLYRELWLRNSLYLQLRERLLMKGAPRGSA